MPNWAIPEASEEEKNARDYRPFVLGTPSIVVASALVTCVRIPHGNWFTYLDKGWCVYCTLIDQNLRCALTSKITCSKSDDLQWRKNVDLEKVQSTTARLCTDDVTALVRVFADSVLTPFVVALMTSTSNLGGVFPHDLGEVTGG